MRWLSFAILAYLIIAIQMGLSGFLDWGGASPNLVLPVAVFIAINARREQALAGALVLGALQDLFTQQPFGLYAFSYGLVSLFVVGARPAVYRDHPLTHFFVTLLGGLTTGAVVLLNDWVYPMLHHTATGSGLSVSRLLWGALYSALLSPFLLGALARIKRVFAFHGTRAMMSSGRFARSGDRSI